MPRLLPQEVELERGDTPIKGYVCEVLNNYPLTVTFNKKVPK